MTLWLFQKIEEALWTALVPALKQSLYLLHQQGPQNAGKYLITPR